MGEVLRAVLVSPFLDIAGSPAFFAEVLFGGIAAGLMYSLVALGFVLIFKASGVFNFAQGVMVLFAALTLVGLMERGVPVWLALNDNDPSPAGLRFRFLDHTTWVLAPLETLSVYQGVEVAEPATGDQVRRYLPRKIMEQRADATLKPGFVRQMTAFVTGNHGPAATLDDARRVLETIKEIRHAGSLSGAPQAARSPALVAHCG